MRTHQGEIDITARRGRKTNGKALGRKDADKQEKVIELKIVRDRIDELIDLHNAAAEAGAKFGDAIKSTAEKSGLLSATVRKFVVARAGEEFAETARRVQQLALVFEEVGG
jgi:hypothetical protein